MVRRNILAFAAAAAVFAAFAAPSLAEPVKLHYRFAAGSVAKFSVSSGRDVAVYDQGTGTDLRTSTKSSAILLTQSVSSVGADGSAVVKLSYDSFTVNGDKEVGEVNLPLPVHLLISGNGSSRVYQDTVAQLGSDQPESPSSPVTIPFPDNSVDVGQSWTTEVPLAAGTAKLVSTLIGPDVFGTTPAWRIYQEVSTGNDSAPVPIGGVLVKGRNYILVSQADCSLLKVVSTLTTVTVGQTADGQPKKEKAERTYSVLARVQN